MIWIVDLFPLKGIDLALLLCQIPISFGNNGFVLPIVNRELRLFDYVISFLVPCFFSVLRLP